MMKLIRLARAQQRALDATLARIEEELAAVEPPPLLEVDHSRRMWTESDDATIRRMIDVASVTEIARVLGRTYHATAQRIHRLRTKRSAP